MRYSQIEAENLHMKAVKYGLSGAELLKDSDTVIRECNGIGADWMPDCMRTLCTKLNFIMEVPAAIHDIRYARGVAKTDKNAADMEFLTNCIKVINNEYAWWNPWRYIMSRRAVRYYTYLQLFGGTAWEEARRKK